MLDGGNVVGGRDRVIVCEKVFSENPGWAESELIRRLGQLFEVGEMIVIPTEPGDVVGHADGVVRFGDGDVVLVNDYRNVDARYQTALRRVLKRAGLEVIELPYSPKAGKARGIPSASGCYINYLRVGRLIILPCFGLTEDGVAQGIVRQYFPAGDLSSLDCSDLSAEGGVLNCVSWTLRGSPLTGPDKTGTGTLKTRSQYRSCQGLLGARGWCQGTFK